MKRKLFIILFGTLALIGGAVHAQGVTPADPFRLITGNIITTRNASSSLRIPKFGGAGTLCLQTDNSGNISTSTAACGSGSGGSTTTLNSVNGPNLTLTIVSTTTENRISTSTGANVISVLASSTWGKIANNGSDYVSSTFRSNLGLGALATASTVPYASTTGVQDTITWPIGVASTSLAVNAPLSLSGNTISFNGGNTTTTVNMATGTVSLTFATSGQSNISIASSSIGTGRTWTFSQPTSTASVNGYLSAADWTTFNAKQNNITWPIAFGSSTHVTILAGTGISVSTSNGSTTVTNASMHVTSTIAAAGGTATGNSFIIASSGPALSILCSTATCTISLPTSTASQTGVLSSTDWGTFNGKQNNISWPIGVASTSLAVNAPLSLSGNTISFNGGNTTTSLNGLTGAITLSTTTTGNAFTITTSSQNIAFNFPYRINKINDLATTTGGVIVASSSPNGWGLLAIGTNGKVLTASSSAPNGVSWETVTGGAGTPAGSTNSIQYNDGGAFGANSIFVWDIASSSLLVGTSTAGSLITGDTQEAPIYAWTNADRQSFIGIHNDNATGLNAAAVIGTKADTARINFQSHGSGRTALTSRWGVTLAGWNELLGVGGNGFAFGNTTANPLIIGNSSTNRIEISSTTETVFNNPGNDWDFRVEGDNELNLFMADAGNNRIGIGTSTPNTLLDVNGSSTIRGDFYLPNLGTSGCLSLGTGSLIGTSTCSGGSGISSINGDTASAQTIVTSTGSYIGSNVTTSGGITTIALPNPALNRIVRSNAKVLASTALSSFGNSAPTIYQGNGNVNADDAVGSFVRYSSTTANGAAGIIITAGGGRADWLPDSTFHIRTGATSTQMRYWIGISQAFIASATAGVGTSTPPNHTAAFRYASDYDTTGFWAAVTKTTGNNITTVTTTVPFATSTPYRMRIRFVSTSSIEFYINNALVATSTTNIPTGSTQMSAAIVSSPLTASSSAIDFNYYSVIHNEP